jgi:hypothetical protein
MRFDLEHGGQSIAYIHRACVLAWALNYVFSVSWQKREERTGVLVSAMLAPHRSEHAQLDDRGLTTEHFDDLRVFLITDRETAQRFRSDSR